MNENVSGARGTARHVRGVAPYEEFGIYFQTAQRVPRYIGLNLTKHITPIDLGN